MSLYEWLTLLVAVLTVEREKGENFLSWLREAVWDCLHPFFLCLCVESTEVCKEGGRQW